MWNFAKIANFIPTIIGAVLTIENDAKLSGLSRADKKKNITDIVQTVLSTTDAIVGHSVVSDADVLTSVGSVIDGIYAILDAVASAKADKAPFGALDFNRVLSLVLLAFSTVTTIESEAPALKGSDKKAAGLAIVKTTLDASATAAGHALVDETAVLTALGSLFDAYVALHNIVTAVAPVPAPAAKPA